MTNHQRLIKNAQVYKEENSAIEKIKTFIKKHKIRQIMRIKNSYFMRNGQTFTIWISERDDSVNKVSWIKTIGDRIATVE